MGVCGFRGEEPRQFVQEWGNPVVNGRTRLKATAELLEFGGKPPGRGVVHGGFRGILGVSLIVMPLKVVSLQVVEEAAVGVPDLSGPIPVGAEFLVHSARNEMDLSPALHDHMGVGNSLGARSRDGGAIQPCEGLGD